MYLARCSLNLLREDLEIYLNRFPSVCSFNWNHDRFSQNVTRIENEASLAKEKNCAYCDKTGNLTKEHVYPDCFLRELDSISIAQTPKGDKAISTATTLRGMNCAWRKSNRQPILRCSGNWKASTGRRWESGIRNPELLLRQWIRLLSRLFRARCSEAVSNSSRAPSGSFDRIPVWGYKPFNDAAGRTLQVSPPPQEARDGYL
jgi:hypothetical protein